MKYLFIIAVLVVTSCNQNIKNSYTEYAPKILFDGSKLIDKNRNDSIVCNLKKDVLLPKTYNYNDNFDLKTFLMENQQSDLQIKEIKNFENKVNITTCGCGFDKILMNQKKEFFLISFKNISTKVSVAEYAFNNKEDLLNAYTMFFNYAEFTRNLSRDKYQFRCCDPWEYQIYYAACKGNKLFLINDSSNYGFDSANPNIQSQIKRNLNIKMDDIYQILK